MRGVVCNRWEENIAVTTENCRTVTNLIPTIRKELDLMNIPLRYFSLLLNGEEVLTGSTIDELRSRMELDNKIIVKVAPSGNFRFFTSRFCLPGQCCGHSSIVLVTYASRFSLLNIVILFSFPFSTALIPLLSPKPPALVSCTFIRTFSARLAVVVGTILEQHAERGSPTLYTSSRV